jgi:hypothetical protein
VAAALTLFTVNSGDSGAGGSTTAVAADLAAFVLGFLVETRGIGQKWFWWTGGILVPSRRSRIAKAIVLWTARDQKGSKWNLINHLAFEAFAPQHGKGNFAVSSPPNWRTLAAMSNEFSPRIARMILHRLPRRFDSRQFAEFAPFFLCGFRPGGCYKLKLK